MFVFRDFVFNSHAPRYIPSQVNGSGNIFINRRSYRLGDTHHLEDRGSVTTAH